MLDFIFGAIAGLCIGVIGACLFANVAFNDVFRNEENPDA